MRFRRVYYRRATTLRSTVQCCARPLPEQRIIPIGATEVSNVLCVCSPQQASADRRGTVDCTICTRATLSGISSSSLQCVADAVRLPASHSRPHLDPGRLFRQGSLLSCLPTDPLPEEKPIRGDKRGSAKSSVTVVECFLGFNCRSRYSSATLRQC